MPPEPGTVSHGTLREQDLVPAFLSVLEEHASEAHERITDQYPNVIEALRRDPDGIVDWDPVHWLMEDLVDALDEAAPDGYWFGAHEGDGADFGFWEIEDQ